MVAAVRNRLPDAAELGERAGALAARRSTVLATAVVLFVLAALAGFALTRLVSG